MTSTELVTILFWGVALGLIPAVLAHRKGRGFWTWWLFGSLFWIIAIVAVFVVEDRRPKCPECREPVQREAVRCPHCQAEIGGRIVEYVTPSP
jgi:hypothetical protein